MLILGKIKDYYDYIIGIYGVDNNIIYDRRKCTLLDKIPSLEYFTNNKLSVDSVKTLQNNWVLLDNGKHNFEKTMCGKFYYYILEIGYCHIYFQVERYLNENDKVIIEPTLLQIKKDCDKISSFPMAIIPLYGFGTHKHRDVSWLKPSKGQIDNFPNPILSSSYISGFIDADFVYNELYNYFISTKEKNIKDNRNDIQKLESHGFDKKISFRGKNK